MNMKPADNFNPGKWLIENKLTSQSKLEFLIEKQDNSKYKGENRIILIGPPTVGKSTVAEELSKELDIEYVQLDELQGKYGYGLGKELELVKDVLSPKFKKYNTPSILDFGGGHVYNKGIDKLLSDYSNVFLLTPSNDYKESKEILAKGNYERLAGFMDQIIQGLKSGKHKHTKEKEEKLIDTLEKMKKGEEGLIKKEDLPNIPEMKDWRDFNMKKGWDKEAPLTDKENKTNQSIARHTIAVYNKNGTRKDKKDIVEDIIKLLK